MDQQAAELRKLEKELALAMAEVPALNEEEMDLSFTLFIGIYARTSRTCWHSLAKAPGNPKLFSLGAKLAPSSNFLRRLSRNEMGK